MTLLFRGTSRPGRRSLSAVASSVVCTSVISLDRFRVGVNYLQQVQHAPKHGDVFDPCWETLFHGRPLSPRRRVGSEVMRNRVTLRFVSRGHRSVRQLRASQHLPRADLAGLDRKA
jgi:hypothetical protein